MTWLSSFQWQVYLVRGIRTSCQVLSEPWWSWIQEPASWSAAGFRTRRPSLPIVSGLFCAAGLRAPRRSSDGGASRSAGGHSALQPVADDHQEASETTVPDEAAWCLTRPTFTDFSDFLGRLQPSTTTIQKPLDTLGVEESCRSSGK